MNRPNMMHACLQGAGELFQGISGQYHYHLSYLTIIKHSSNRTPYILTHTHLSYHPSHVTLSQLLTLLRELLDGVEATGHSPSESSQRRTHQLKAIHDLLHSSGTMSSGNTTISIHYSLLLALYLLQVRDGCC